MRGLLIPVDRMTTLESDAKLFSLVWVNGRNLFPYVKNSNKKLLTNSLFIWSRGLTEIVTNSDYSRRPCALFCQGTLTTKYGIIQSNGSNNELTGWWYDSLMDTCVVDCLFLWIVLEHLKRYSAWYWATCWVCTCSRMWANPWIRPLPSWSWHKRCSL